MHFWSTKVRARVLASTALFFCALYAMPVSASVMIAYSLRQLVAKSDRIALATVIHQQSLWDEDGRIVTDSRLRIDEPVKGSDVKAGTEVVVRTLGGAIGRLGMRVEGAARFSVGERAVVFLIRNPHDGTLRTVGMSQGVLHVQNDAGVDRAFPGGTGLALVQRGGSQLVDAQGALTEPRELRALLQDLRTLVSETSAR